MSTLLILRVFIFRSQRVVTLSRNLQVWQIYAHVTLFQTFFKVDFLYFYVKLSAIRRSLGGKSNNYLKVKELFFENSAEKSWAFSENRKLTVSFKILPLTETFSSLILFLREKTIFPKIKYFWKDYSAIVSWRFYIILRSTVLKYKGVHLENILK